MESLSLITIAKLGREGGQTLLGNEPTDRRRKEGRKERRPLLELAGRNRIFCNADDDFAPVYAPTEGQSVINNETQTGVAHASAVS